ncbi:MAG: MaoC/PaaZ C-terminal domain-containing protein [Chloroflexota bacterium]|nr:MaoC family dehydratase N-terminal domain-containing protein [Anaerolineae bacterium]
MEDAIRPRGLFFEEFEVGTETISPGRTVTEADVIAFAGLSGDYNQLHTDAEFAKGSPFGARIAHGLLGLSMASGLASRIGLMEGTVLAFMGLNWKFKAPIMIGDTISLRIRVAKKREAAQMGGGIIILSIYLHNQHGEVVQEGSWTILVRSSPSA